MHINLQVEHQFQKFSYLQNLVFLIWRLFVLFLMVLWQQNLLLRLITDYFLNMNWSQPRKTYKSSQKRNQRVSTTCLNTPPKQLTHPDEEDIMIIGQKQCPYHFGQPSHVCMQCRRSICLRCAITYCQQHTIHPEEQILPLLLVDLQKLTIQPRVEDIQFKLKQSQQRQQYISRKISKILDQIQQNFQHLRAMLQRKKQQILQYYQDELADKYLGQYRKYDQELLERRKWLQSIGQMAPSCTSIQQLDELADIIKKQINTENGKNQVKAAKNILGKDKLKLHKIWSQQKLQKVLFEIENISYRVKQGNSSLNSTTKKKRVTTQASETNKISPFSINPKSPFAGILRSTSNSRFPTGRKIQS